LVSVFPLAQAGCSTLRNRTAFRKGNNSERVRQEFLLKRKVT